MFTVGVDADTRAIFYICAVLIKVIIRIKVLDDQASYMGVRLTLSPQCYDL